MCNMRQLWDEASQYGRVTIRTQNNGLFSCTIDFNTIEHVELTARSSFKAITPEEALKEAIEKAEVILASLEKTAKDIKYKQIGKDYNHDP